MDDLLIKVREGVFAFPPNPICNGGRSWWLSHELEPALIDCPPVNEEVLDILRKLSFGKKPQIILTSREGHGNVAELHEELGWPVLIQEQEAYLLPGINNLESFAEDFNTSSGLRLLWTPGPTPGSCVVHAISPWNVLFCGRLLIPVKPCQLAALRTRRTFHWKRQQQSLEKLRKWIPQDSSPSLASGSSLQLLGDRLLVDWEGW